MGVVTTADTGLRATEARSLDGFPEVNALLEKLELGVLRQDDCDSFVGRNPNWAGTTTKGFPVFIKSLGPLPKGDALGRLRRTHTFDVLRDRVGFTRLRSPKVLGHDEPSGLVVSRLLGDAVAGDDLAGDTRFPEWAAREAGGALAELHSVPPLDSVDRTPPVLPPLELLSALPLETYYAATLAELELWQCLQSDAALSDALVTLRRRESAAHHTMIHADLRLDQLLITPDNKLYFIDWEEFRVGDPARDVGSFLGEWLYLATLSMSENDDLDHVPDSASGPHPIDDQAIVRRGVRKLDQHLPHMTAFWKEYQVGRPAVDSAFRARTTAYAGWHLIDRVLALASQRATLPALALAAAGIGRLAVIRPEHFAGALGLKEQT